MLQICCAESGEVFQVNVSVLEIKNLEHFIHEHTGIEESAILAYLPDGSRLRTENIRDLAGAEDQTLYVFNKVYLDMETNLVLQSLRVTAPLQPPVEETMSSTPPLRPSHVASSYLRTTHIHLEEVNRTLRELRHQYDALRIASNALDLHVLAIQEAFEAIASGAQHELEKQRALLVGLAADLELVKRVPIHKEFVSQGVRKAMDLGDRGRTLGDYVSHEKMKQVADTCAKTHGDLTERMNHAQDAMMRLRDGTGHVRGFISDTTIVDEAEMCARRSREAASKATDLLSILEKTPGRSDRVLQEMRQSDNILRNELQRIVQMKNSYTEQCIQILRQISVLNTDVVQLPPYLTSLQASFRVKTSFAHIQRLHNMLYAYGATVVEIVRRKEFAQFFFERAQNILEVMAKMTANERKRRQVYRSEIHGQLPFETKGMDDPVPMIDFTPVGSSDVAYALERTDIFDLMDVLNDLERFSRESSHPAAISSVQETRAGLEKLISKMDGLQAGFDRIAERSLLSSSRFLEFRRRSTEADDQAIMELETHIAHLNEVKTEQERRFAEEKRVLEEELLSLRSRLSETDDTHDEYDRNLRSLKAQLESETQSRRILERRNMELSSEAEAQRQALADALAEATQRTEDAETARQELARVRSEFDEMKEWEHSNSEKISNLLEDQAAALRRLEEARARGEDLESQIEAARLESEETKRALEEARKEKDRLLRAQASEHDRIMRDHIAEADGDRAVLEHQYLELKASLEDAQRQLKDARAQVEMSASDAVGLREELQRVEHGLREARHAERVLRDDLRAGRASQSDFEQKQETSSRLIAEILDVALSFRESHLKALATVQTLTSHPASTTRMSVSPNLTDSGLGVRRGILNLTEEAAPIDPSDPASALEALRAFDHDRFAESINKVGQTIRKWQKQCKDYREKAKGKISFRNFAKGDLALFLPTRNSVTKPWAAFNVSFPHYFLKPTGHLGEQLKTREWIVARITSITEGIVDHKDASTNPYGLGDGVKYYMLEVEDWTQPAHSSKRRGTPRKLEAPKNSLDHTSINTTTPEPPAGLSPDQEMEIEETFPSLVTAKHPTASRARGNSITSAGPSSLSRLLAQAPPNQNVDPEDHPPHPSPPSPLPAPSHPTSTPRSGSIALPHRPGSRGSRVSTSSRFSSGRIPFVGGAGTSKAIATTALTAEQPVSTPSTSSAAHSGSETVGPSPEGSPTEGMNNFLPQHRRRATSYHPVAKSPLATLTSLPEVQQVANLSINHAISDGDISRVGVTARTRLASLASSWGVPFARKKATDSPLNGDSLHSSYKGTT